MIGTEVQNYQINELIDEGGMGSIYLGVHKYLHREVAIKDLNPMLRNNPDIIERFRHEAFILSKLQHQNIVALYDYVETPENHYIIMEYVQGETLADYIETTSGPILENKAISMFLKILDAMSYAHSQNIFHRDIKPSNFIINKQNNIKILDFGIAKKADSQSPRLTKTGLKVGTTMFMSPQQVKGEELDYRTDIYSLGVTLFQMLTGQLPYDEKSSEYDLFDSIVNYDFPNPKDFYVGVSPAMCKVIKKATQKQPEDRYQSCDEFSKALLGINRNARIEIPLNLKTKIYDLSDEDHVKPPVFNRAFWRNLVLIILSVSFFVTIAVGFYFMIKSDMRHVIGHEQKLYNNADFNSKSIEKLRYGETVKVIKNTNSDQDDDQRWLKVVSLRGNSGFIPLENLAKPKIYEQINAMFGNNEAQILTPIKYKKLLRYFFATNNLFRKVNIEWKLKALNKKTFEFNSILKADFNNNDHEDWACVLTNNTNKNTKLLIFLDNETKPLVYNFDENVSIKRIWHGKKGGAWYLGDYNVKNGSKGRTFKTKKYEYLPHDGVLLYKEKSKKSIVYYLNLEENIMAYFEQPN